MNNSIEKVQEPHPNKATRNRWTSIGLGLISIVFVGQTASLYIPAFAGISPAAGGTTQVAAKMLGGLLWPMLGGVLIQKLRDRPRYVGAIGGIVVAVLLYFGSFIVAAQNG